MITRSQLDQFLKITLGEELLQQARSTDPENGNGLQVAGKSEIHHIALGVSLSVDFLTEAVKAQADTVITHHGLRFEMPYQQLEDFAQKRLDLIFRHRLNAYGLHYMLDAHREIGNNAVIASLLGAKLVEPYHETWGWIADLPQETSVEEISKRLSGITAHDVFAVYAGPKKIKRLGIVSGFGIASGMNRVEIKEKRIQAHITGEITEWMVDMFKEMEVNYLAAGHYATEVFGVQELGKKIKEQFRDQIEVEFIDIPNPI